MNQDPNQSVPTTTPPVPNTTNIQPQPTPVMTAQQPPVYSQPTTGAPVQQPYPMQGGGKKGGTGKVLIIIGAVVGALLLIGVAVFAYLMLSGPTKKDYADAKDVAQQAADQISSMDSATQGYFISTSYITKSGSELQGMLDDYKSSVDELKGMKALRDKEAKSLYDSFQTKNDKIMSFIGAVAKNSDVLKKMFDSCSADKASQLSYSTGATIGTDYDTYIGPCIEDIRDFTATDDSILKNYATSMLAAYEKQQNLYHELQEAYINRDVSKFNSVPSEIRSQVKDFDAPADDLKSAIKAVDPTDELNKLGEYLTDKAND